MSQTIPESIDATIVINLYFDNQLVLNTKGILAGFENTF
jgi:uncharacterized Fe-S cluster-containing radical SAM superfamily protein